MRVFLAGVAAAAALAAAAPMARADDASLKAAVDAEQPQFATALNKFESAAETKHLRTDRGIKRAKLATSRLAKATQHYYNGVSVQQASTQAFADARQHLLIGLVRYKQGLGSYRKALTALREHHAASAKRRVRQALSRFKAAQKQFLKAEVLVL